MAERKKISELEELTTLSGEENLLLGLTGDNKRATTKTFKDFIGENVVKLFTTVIPESVNVITGIATPEDNSVIDVVYLESLGRFASRKTISGASSYYSAWSDSADYQTDSVPRSDRLYYCIESRIIYAWNGSLTDVRNATLEESIDSNAKSISALTTDLNNLSSDVENNSSAIKILQDSALKLQESTEEEIEQMIADGTWTEGVIYYTVEE